MNASQADFSAAFLECLRALDVVLIRKLWRQMHPGLPQPDSDAEALASLHLARTECPAIMARERMYSHAWLRERSLPSLLPDHMRASAERMFPVVARAVGISVNASSPLLRPAMKLVQSAMADAVLEAYADRASDAVVKRHMMEARDRELGKLLGMKHG